MQLATLIITVALVILTIRVAYDVINRVKCRHSVTAWAIDDTHTMHATCASCGASTGAPTVASILATTN